MGVMSSEGLKFGSRIVGSDRRASTTRGDTMNPSGDLKMDIANHGRRCNTKSKSPTVHVAHSLTEREA